MAGSIPKGVWSSFSDSAAGAPISSYSSGAFVVNTNAKAVQTGHFQNVQEILNGSATNHANVIPLATMGAAYLHISARWKSDTSGVTLSTDPVVRVFGHVPNPREPSLRSWPQDIDSNFNDLNASNIPEAFRGVWVPLGKPDRTMGTAELTLPSDGIIDDNGSVTEGNTDEQWVFLAGCDFVIVTVETAAVFSAGSTTEAVILGRLTG